VLWCFSENDEAEHFNEAARRFWRLLWRSESSDDDNLERELRLLGFNEERAVVLGFNEGL
jgi:hypothetical protein